MICSRFYLTKAIGLGSDTFMFLNFFTIEEEEKFSNS